MTARLPGEYRLDPETALRLLREEIFPRFSIHDLQPGLRDDFLVSAVGEGTAGGKICDTPGWYTARSTENRRHFTPLLRHGIRVLTISELVEETGR